MSGDHAEAMLVMTDPRRIASPRREHANAHGVQAVVAFSRPHCIRSRQWLRKSFTQADALVDQRACASRQQHAAPRCTVKSVIHAGGVLQQQGEGQGRTWMMTV